MTERRRCQGCTMYHGVDELTDDLCSGCQRQAATLGISAEEFKAWARDPKETGRVFEYKAIMRGLIGDA